MVGTSSRTRPDQETSDGSEHDDLPPAYVVTPEEGRRMYDDAVRKYMGISGEEFLRRLDSGEYDSIADDPDHSEIMDLAMLRSFGR